MVEKTKGYCQLCLMQSKECDISILSTPCLDGDTEVVKLCEFHLRKMLMAFQPQFNLDEFAQFIYTLIKNTKLKNGKYVFPETFVASTWTEISKNQQEGYRSFATAILNKYLIEKKSL